jgi:hypothetical protein
MEMQDALAQANAEAAASQAQDNGIAAIRPDSARLLAPLSPARRLIIGQVVASAVGPTETEMAVLGAYVLSLPAGDAWRQAREPETMIGAAYTWAETLSPQQFEAVMTELTEEMARLDAAGQLAERAIPGGGEADPTSRPADQ